VGWLGTGDWQLREAKGQVYLEKSPYSGSAAHTRWSVSAPAIRARGGQQLGYDAKGRDPKVRLVTEKSEDKSAEGASARWAFEVVKRLEPRYEFARGGRSREEVRVGYEGMTFRAMATEGRYKGWYLATKVDGKGKTRLVLVREKKEAAVFKYVARHYWARENK